MPPNVDTINLTWDSLATGIAVGKGDAVTYSETVSIKDLWEVYPELRVTRTPEKFRDQVEKAARFSREHNAFHNLRDLFVEEALHTTLRENRDVLKFEDETETENKEEK